MTPAVFNIGLNLIKTTGEHEGNGGLVLTREQGEPTMLL